MNKFVQQSIIISDKVRVNTIMNTGIDKYSQKEPTLTLEKNTTRIIIPVEVLTNVKNQTVKLAILMDNCYSTKFYFYVGEQKISKDHKVRELILDDTGSFYVYNFKDELKFKDKYIKFFEESNKFKIILNKLHSTQKLIRYEIRKIKR